MQLNAKGCAENARWKNGRHLTLAGFRRTLSVMATRGLVISDLHLLARRSVGETLLNEIEPQLQRCEVLVLNGDTFDFRWSTLASEAASIDAAIAWVEAWAARFAGRKMHFIEGNHDCHGEFRQRLDDLAESLPQVHVHEQCLLLGDQLFLHGDCANRKMDVAAMNSFRRSWSVDKPRGRFSAAMYDFADKTGLCGQFHRRYFPQGIAVARVAHFLDHALPDWRASASDCYFGHTHLPFRDHQHDGVRFHNTGSGICGMGFQPLQFEFEPQAALP